MRTWSSLLKSNRFPSQKLAAGVLSFLFFGLVFQLNPNSLRTNYGDGGGRWSDRIDSFSEQIIVNKVLNDAFGSGNTNSRFMVITKGYRDLDYSYYPESVSPYYSHFGLHAQTLSTIRSLLLIKSDRGIARFVMATKVLVGWLLALILSIFVTRIFQEYGQNAWFISVLLIGSSTGLILCSQNLYLLLPVLLLPFLISTVAYGSVGTYAILGLILIASVINFLCRYEFATTFAVLATVPFFVFRRQDSLQTKLTLSALSFFAVVVGFLIAIAIHLQFAAYELGGIGDAVKVVLGKAAYRTLTMDQVPVPLSAEFWREILQRWNFAGLAVPLSSLSFNQTVIFLFYLITVLSIRRYDSRAIVLWMVGLSCYLSWYLFAYQHIMWHRHYDWLIFALGIVIPLAGILARIAHRVPRPVMLSMLGVLLISVVSNSYGIKRDDLNSRIVARPDGYRHVIVANDFSDESWHRGILRKNGKTDQFYFIVDAGESIPVAVGSKLFFAGTQLATVQEISYLANADGRKSVFVTVDRNLWVGRDGAPNSIYVY